MESPHNSFIQFPTAIQAFPCAMKSVREKAQFAGFSGVTPEVVESDKFSVAMQQQRFYFSIKQDGHSHIQIDISNNDNALFASITLSSSQGKDVVQLSDGRIFEWHYRASDYNQSDESYMAWLLTSISLGFTIEDSALLSRSALHVSCETWPSQINYFPRLSNKQVQVIERKPSQCFGLYPVVDTVELVEELITSGVKILQLRVKDKSPSEVAEDVKRAIELGRQYAVDIVINDYWQLAIEHQASCIHLGQEDLAAIEDSSLLSSDIGLGISTHGYFEIINALQYKPSYLALGHIFPTTTKDMPSSPQGLIKLNLYQKLIASIGKQRGFTLPSVAIGGIDMSRAPQVIKTGVTSVAVVRAVTLATNKAEVVQQFQNLFNAEKHEAIDVNR
ncbi:thiamine phosphate synthase [Vibrio rarus]|uniref:thiamine phosphate synthase n=1 Tax=Vibrio rarus TaxID=413403 RepID=UPI0021C4B181|nr:thiamine phosphate synthase [Vibrio rarus]